MQIKNFFLLAMLLLTMLINTSAIAGNIFQEPLHGYYIGAINGDKAVQRLYQDWTKAARTSCGRDELILSITPPNTDPNYPLGRLVCEYPEGGGSNLWFTIYWSDVCPDSSYVSIHDPNITCAGYALEKPPCACGDVHGDPVIFSTKSRIEVENDYQPAHQLKFSRFYNSSQTANQPDSMSSLWRHTYSRKLSAQRWGSTSNLTFDYYEFNGRSWYPQIQIATAAQDYVSITKPDGFGYHFTSADRGKTWLADVDVSATLVAIFSTTGGDITEWQLTDENSDVSIYSASGQFIEMQFSHGGGYVLTYSNGATPIADAPRPGLLMKVKDNLNHSLLFRYDSQARMTNMIDSAGNEYSYTYDAENKLVSVVYPDLLSRLYHYDEPDYSANSTSDGNQGLLTGMSDEISSGQFQRYSIFRYSGRNPISTELVGGVDSYTFDYNNSTVTQPLGNVLGVHPTLLLGHYVIGELNQFDISTNGRSYTAFNYDTAGNISSIESTGDKLTCFQYESPRNLETVRIEGLDSYSERCGWMWQASLALPRRKTTTVWHPTLRLPVMIAKPLSIEERVYDGVGNLVTQTITATSDVSGDKGTSATKVGMARVSAFTYDTNGNLLTAKGPRIDVNDITIYTYDATGALRTVINPLGQTTSYSNYDGNGRAGHIANANGTFIDLSYSARGWLTSRTETGQGASNVTSFEYDGIGELIKLTLPDHSAITYSYDAAHRLTDVRDGAGNRVHYTLDKAGNRIREETTGTTGDLTRQTTRVFNVLNQLQQVTGVAQ